MPKLFSASLFFMFFFSMAITNTELLSWITCKYPEWHDSFIFPLVNKSAGIWLIGIGMNAKTVLHRVPAGQAMTSNNGGVMFALMLHRKHTPAKYDAYGIRFQVSIAYKSFPPSDLLIPRH